MQPSLFMGVIYGICKNNLNHRRQQRLWSCSGGGSPRRRPSGRGDRAHPEAKQAFEALDTQRAFGCLLDVTDYAHIDEVVTQSVSAAGPIDVLVNNAGYGHEGILEESSLADMRRQFEVNVFGAVAMIKAVLPGMRQRRHGHILNITSMGGFITLPGISYYCGSKFALEGISDTLSKELAPFNIHVTAVAPGSFRTDWAGRSMVRSARSIPDYDALFDPVRQARQEKVVSNSATP